MSGATLAFDIIGKDRTSAAFNSAAKSSSTLGDKLKSMGKHAAIAGAALVATGVALGGKFLVDSVKGWQDHLKVVAQTEAVIKSTGGAAGLTAKHIGNLADAIERKTGVDGDAIMSGQNLLLTFTNLKNGAGKGNDVFDQTTKLMTDLSVAMGQSTKTSAIQLGKALNDPVAGVSALSKVGVTFTAQQKEQIKTLVESGDTMSAQKVILGELTKEFGGSAASQATTGSRLVAVYHQVQDAVGAKLLPVLSSLGEWFLDKGIPAIQNFVGMLKDKFGPIIGKLVGWFKNDLLPALVSAYQTALPSLKSAFESIQKGLHNLQPMLDFLGKLFVQVLLPVFGTVAKTVLPLLGKAFELVTKEIGLLGKIGMWLWNSVFQPVFKFIVSGVAMVLHWFGSMLEAIGHVPGFGWVGELGKQINGVADGAQAVADNLKKIPTSKHVQITIDTHINANSISGHYAGLVSGLDGRQAYLQTGTP